MQERERERKGREETDRLLYSTINYPNRSLSTKIPKFSVDVVALLGFQY